MCQTEYDPEWWKAAKAQSLERKKKAPKPGAGDSFLIVTEGTVTEPTYFELLRTELELGTVTVKVMPGSDSHPFHVISTAAEEAKILVKQAKKGEIGVDEVAKYDQVWAVIDTDVATRQNQWKEVVALAKSSKVLLADSTPCFEYWILLHLKYTTGQIENGASAKGLVDAELGTSYSTNEGETLAAFLDIVEKWPEAVAHAERVRKHHDSAGTTLPANPSTSVDKLVRFLNNAAPLHKQRLD